MNMQRSVVKPFDSQDHAYFVYFDSNTDKKEL